MPYGKLSDSIDDDPKLLAAGRKLGREGYCRALAVWIQAIVHCRRHNTDGVISRDAAEWFRPGQKVAIAVLEAFVEVGLVERHGTGWQIVNWHKHYDPAEVIETRRAVKRDRSRGAVSHAHAGSRDRARDPARGIAGATETDTDTSTQEEEEEARSRAPSASGPKPTAKQRTAIESLSHELDETVDVPPTRKAAIVVIAELKAKVAQRRGRNRRRSASVVAPTHGKYSGSSRVLPTGKKGDGDA